MSIIFGIIMLAFSIFCWLQKRKDRPSGSYNGLWWMIGAAVAFIVMLCSFSVAIFAMGTQHVIHTEEHIAWYWLAMITIVAGPASGNSLTYGYKRWRRDHKQLPLRSSETRLVGRILAALSTAGIWWMLATMESTESNIMKAGFVLAFIAFALSNKIQDAIEWSVPYAKAAILNKLGIKDKEE